MPRWDFINKRDFMWVNAYFNPRYDQNANNIDNALPSPNRIC
jgi:hypothetical protein